MQRFSRKHGKSGWVLRCDIAHYFAETLHSVAKEAIAKRVKCRESVDKTFDIIDSFGEGKGIGLGSQVSQITQLAVLDDMDHFIKEQLGFKYYIRYMDDFILLHHDREYIESARIEIGKKLSKLGLELNKKTNIFPLSQGIVF